MSVSFRARRHQVEARVRWTATHRTSARQLPSARQQSRRLPMPRRRLRLLVSDGSTSLSRCCPHGMLAAQPAGPNNPMCFGAQSGVARVKYFKPVKSLDPRTQGPVVGQRPNGQGTEKNGAQGDQRQAESVAHRSAARHRRTHRPAQGADRQPGRESVEGALQGRGGPRERGHQANDRRRFRERARCSMPPSSRSTSA